MRCQLSSGVMEAADKVYTKMSDKLSIPSLMM